MKYKFMLIIIIGLLLVNIVNAGSLAEKAITKIACSQQESCKIYKWIISPEGTLKDNLFLKLPAPVQRAITDSKDPIETAYSYIYAQLPKEAEKAINIVNEFESYLKDFQKIDTSSKTAQTIGDNIEYNEKEKLLTLKNKDGSIFAKIPTDAYAIDPLADPKDGFRIRVVDADKAKLKSLQIMDFSISNIPREKGILIKEANGVVTLVLDEGNLIHNGKTTTTINNVKNAEIRIKNKEIEYAKFISTKANTQYRFNYRGESYTFQNTFSNNGFIEFDPSNKKINANSATIKKGNQIINSKFGNVYIDLTNKGNIDKIIFKNCDSKCSYEVDHINVNSKNDFNLYFNKDIQQKDVTALSINSLIEKVDGIDVPLTEINSKGEITYTFKDKRVEAFKGSETNLVTDSDGDFPTLNINKGTSRFYNGKYGGIIKNINDKTKITRIDRDYLLKQEESSPLFIGEDAVVANGLLGVNKIDSYGNREVKNMFAKSNTIDVETFRNLKASEYIESLKNSIYNIRKGYDGNVARVECSFALGIGCPIKVYDKELEALKDIQSKLYKGVPVNNVLRGNKLDTATQRVIQYYSRDEEPVWDSIANDYINQGGGYELHASIARENYYNNLADKIGLNEGLTGKIHRGIETKPGKYKLSEIVDPLDRRNVPIAITSSKDLVDLKKEIKLGNSYTLNDGTKLNLDDLNKEIERVKKLEKENPQLFRQLSKYDELQKKQYWKELPEVVAKEATTFVTAEVATVGLFKGYKVMKGLVKLPATRYAQVYSMDSNIQRMVYEGDTHYFKYSNKKQALKNYFFKGGGYNEFYDDIAQLSKKEFVDEVEKSIIKYNPNFKKGTINRIKNVKTDKEIIDIFKNPQTLNAGEKEAVKSVYSKMGNNNFKESKILLDNIEKQVQQLNIDPVTKNNFINRIKALKNGVVKVEKDVFGGPLETFSPSFNELTLADNVGLTKQKGINKLQYVYNKKIKEVGNVKVFGNTKKLLSIENSYGIYHNYKVLPIRNDISYVKKTLDLEGVRYTQIGNNGIRIDGRNFFYENGKWILR